jgi:small-conductance mechanosensitive channel
MEGNVEGMQDLMKNLQQDNPQLQEQINEFMNSLEQAKARAEKEGRPPPSPDQMGGMGQMMNPILKDRTRPQPPIP